MKTYDSEIKINIDGKGQETDNIWEEWFCRTVKRGHVYLHTAKNGIELHRSVCRVTSHFLSGIPNFTRTEGLGIKLS